MVKIKDKKHHLAIAIKENFAAGMKPKDIAKLFNLSKQRVNYWIHSSIRKRKRRSKLTRKEINIIVKWAKNKPIMEKKVSAKNIQIKFNKLSKKFKENKKKKSISLSTANRVLNKYIGKPRVIRKVFYLKPIEKKLRVQFLKFMKENGITPGHIFFTDESIFPLYSYMNKGTNKIRLSKKTRRKLKSGDEKSINLVTRQHHKFHNGIMVSGGVCNEGLGEIVFHSGNLNSFAYKQVLKFYREDLNKYPTKLFQQDGARSHGSKLSRNMIKFLFKDKFIPTWDNYLKINNKFVPRWPPNSPDLSAIEMIWAIIKQMLILFPPKDMESLKNTIKLIWDSIPKTICENIINHMEQRWELCIKYKGRRLDKELLRKIPKIKNDIKWGIKKQEINGVRVSYNDKFVLKLKKKDIKEKKKKLTEQKKIEREAKIKFDKLLKMKPREYKGISKKEKEDIKYQYGLEKARREVIEEDIDKLERMVPLEYLTVLNDETKEKLIGLCLDRKLMDTLDEDGETMPEEDEIEDGIEDEEMALEEDIE